MKKYNKPTLVIVESVDVLLASNYLGEEIGSGWDWEI